ncbi:membrane protein insertase YidC [Francisellaceae bacterium]|nr:membrane protein insertase YidC [Francisellaceae bacterium]
MKTNQIRIVLLVALAFVFMMIYGKWNAMFNPPQKSTPAAQISSEVAKTSKASSVPNIQIGTQTPTLTSNSVQKHLSTPTSKASVKEIAVKTDVFDLKISPINGSITNLSLKKYNTTLHDKTPLVIFNNKSDSQYIAQSGVINKELNQHDITFTAPKMDYTIGAAKTLTVALNAKVDGIELTKTYTFTKNSYDIKVKQTIHNASGKNFSGRFYGQLLRKDNTKSTSLLDMHSYATYSGATLSSTKDRYQKESFKDIHEQAQNIQTTQGWAAMVQHYFLSAWIPENSKANEKNMLFTRSLGNQTYGVGAAMPAFTLTPGQSFSDNSQLYVGPAIKKNLDTVAPNLSLTVDYGWLWFISDLIFWAMSLIYGLVGNWGVAIILVTFLIKLIFFPLSAKSYKSMAKMRLLQPKIKQLKEQHGDDKQKMTQQMMQMYKREKVNPLGGCLPMIVQIPVFIALYWVLLESVQLRQAPFMFWIHDLSVKDPYYVLPILMGLSMFVQQRLNPAPPDPMQAKIMMFMPVIFTVMFLNFPAGLVLYWLTNNVLGVLQQWWVMKQVEKSASKAKISRK